MTADRAAPATAERGVHGSLDARVWWPLVGGLALFGLAAAAGRDPRALGAIVTPPALTRAILVGLAALAALACLRAALVRLQASAAPAGHDLPTMVRGIRLVFLAVAAAAAGAAWLLGHPLPLIVAAIIAAVDVVETTFLLLVVSTRRGRG